MVARISDPRVTQAVEHGRIVGLPPDDAHRIALIADMVTACATPLDLCFLFEGLDREAQLTWRVTVDSRWTLAFEWIDGMGAIDIRLE